MNKIFTSIIFFAILLLGGCKNSVEQELLTTEQCQLQLGNPRGDWQLHSAECTGIGTSAFHKLTLDYYGSCLDTNVYFTCQIDFLFKNTDSKQYEILNTINLVYAGNSRSFDILNKTVTMGFCIIFASSDMIRYTVVGYYGPGNSLQTEPVQWSLAKIYTMQ